MALALDRLCCPATRKNRKNGLKQWELTRYQGDPSRDYWTASREPFGLAARMNNLNKCRWTLKRLTSTWSHGSKVQRSIAADRAAIGQLIVKNSTWLFARQPMPVARCPVPVARNFRTVDREPWRCLYNCFNRNKKKAAQWRPM